MPSAIHYETEIRMVPVAGGESVLLPEGIDRIAGSVA